jgi:hypothetical protein
MKDVIPECPDCGAGVGQLHKPGCEYEQCPYCGGPLHLCIQAGGPDRPYVPAFPPPQDDRLPWTGFFPGEAEALEFGWYCRPARDGQSWVACDKGDPDAQPDVPRVYGEAVWDRQEKRYVLPRERRGHAPNRLCALRHGGAEVVTVEVCANPSDPRSAALWAKEMAEVQAALDAWRAAGVPRPVVFVVRQDDAQSRRAWRDIEPALRARGRPFFCTGPAGVGYVLSVADARAVLRPILGRHAARLFRAPSQPIGHWTVEVRGDGYAVMESSTFDDLGRAA